MNTTKPRIDWKQLEVGGMWKREENNETRFSAKLKIKNREFGIVVLPNKFKNSEKEPDFRVYLSPSSYKELFGKEAPTLEPKNKSIVQDAPTTEEKEKVFI